MRYSFAVRRYPFKTNASRAGFTLIELIIGIVVLATAMTMLSSLIFPQVQRSIDPIYQLRATELANTLINEIQGKAFDENSNPALGIVCDVGANNCTAPDSLAPEEASRDLYDDIDDYHGFDLSGKLLGTISSGSPLVYQNLYANFSLSVTVIYDGNFNGSYGATEPRERSAKRINITVTTPAGEAIEFAVYRSNY